MVRTCVAAGVDGRLDKLYSDIALQDQLRGKKTELVLCCGDFQSWRFYAEKKHAPILTMIVGGSNEASSFLQKLPYGGWISPNIWFMGYAGVVQFAGLRIAGISGIYKQHDYTIGHYEHPPYSEPTKGSVYHLRSLEVFRLGQLRRRVDIVLSHDWPRGIYRYGDSNQLLSRKRHFRDEVEIHKLGSSPGEQLLRRLRPRYWFSAYLHWKFKAVVKGDDSMKTFVSQAQYLNMDKCFPERDYLKFLDVEPVLHPAPLDHFISANEVVEVLVSKDDDSAATAAEMYVEKGDQCGSTESLTPSKHSPADQPASQTFLDPEWLSKLKSTNHPMYLSQIGNILPDQQTGDCRRELTPITKQLTSNGSVSISSISSNLEIVLTSDSDFDNETFSL